VIFYLAAIVAVGGAIMMIMQRNPVASVLYMVVSLVAQAILYAQLSAIFIGAILIIVYTGAILVLFLFVIMLLNLRGEKFDGRQSRIGRTTKYGLAVIFFLELIAIFRQLLIPGAPGGGMVTMADDFGSVEMVASRLFREYLYPFELTSILLLVAIVGAVVVAKRDGGKAEKGES
jgi:NADH-quinone oxidoreductase subunit J